MLEAQAPDRFSTKFIENLGFTSTNDRLFIAVLKDLGFLNRDGAPQPRYYEFLDRTKSHSTVAAGIRDAFSELFAVNTRANEMSVDDVKNKLRTLFAGKKTELTIDRIARTFKALAEYGDFSAPAQTVSSVIPIQPVTADQPLDPTEKGGNQAGNDVQRQAPGKIAVSGLNIT